MAKENQEFDNNLRGVLFQNKKREEELNPERKAKMPHYQGSCEIGGIEYWVSGWKKLSKDKKTPYMSLAFSPKEDQKNVVDGDDTDIPF